MAKEVGPSQFYRTADMTTKSCLLQRLDYLVDDMEEFHLNFAEGLFDNSMRLREITAEYRKQVYELRNLVQRSTLTEEKSTLTARMQRAEFLIKTFP